MISIGIDPGLKGALVALAVTNAGIRCVYQRQADTFGDLNPDLMLEALLVAAELDRDVVAVLERVGAMPKQGLSSTFNFGHGRGVWRGLLAGRGWRVLEPTPAKWAKPILTDLPGEGKERAIARASQIAGLQLIPPGKRVAQDGLADAACLALYGLREGA